MKKFHWMTVVFMSALAGFPAVSGCSVDAGEEESVTGSVSMALGTVTNGTAYRLSNAVFQIDGLVSTTLSSSNDPMETVITAVLPVGGYTSTLQSGWTLQRNDGGMFVNVQATLVSPNPIAITVTDGVSTSLVYQFDTDGTIITIGTGQLDISIAVNETTGGPACTAFGSGCNPMSQWCVPAEAIGASANQCLNTGPLQPGDPCDGTVDCAMNSGCGDLGAGPVCLELCPNTAYGDVCPVGGGLCTDIGFMTVGLCM